MTDSQRLPPLPVATLAINDNASSSAATEPKKKRWGPKGHSAFAEPLLVDGSSIQPAGALNAQTEGDFSLGAHNPGSPVVQPASALESVSEQSSSQMNKRKSKPAFGLSGSGIEFQQLVRKQSQLSAQKVEFFKELLQLYSRRNNNERKQEEATKSEQFEEADSATTALRLVQETIQKLEIKYTETDQILWKYKKRQDELGRSVTEMHQAVMQELDQMRQVGEKEKEDHQMEIQRIHNSEMERIQNGREEIEKEKSDVALEQDFLGKNEAELLERVGEETKAEQEELDALKAKRNTIRTEIQELTKRLEQLNNEDKEYGRSIGLLQQKITTISQQFDGEAKEVSRVREELECRSDEVRRKGQDLDRQEINLRKGVHDAEATQEEISEEIQRVVSQQDRLEEVRRLFEAELATIHKLRLEEEAFREMEAGWNIRLSSLYEDLKKCELQIETLTMGSMDDQRAIKELELSLDENLKRLGTTESLKALSVHRRDFKQASHFSSELTKCREMISQQRVELDRLTTKMSGPIQEQLDTMQKECDHKKALIRSEEAALFKEIQISTTEILSRLDTFLAPTSSELGVDEEDKTATSDDTTRRDSSDVATAKSTAGQLSHLLLKEWRSEIEGIRQLSRVRYGHEEGLSANVVVAQAPTLTDTAVTSRTNNTGGPDYATADTEELRRQLDLDIQAAVAEEDYDNAG
ncbi:hypothetical protein BGZ65_002352 [Modicella reniformis]|uniref:Uncharacterized protein n=1 Tax=Modicella reniformis TaxID=1440133 RepID=A0A9P6J657_9FUNG|nr:hypothetical protein BGZ65_002352 [Modicella reniformis]